METKCPPAVLRSNQWSAATFDEAMTCLREDVKQEPWEDGDDDAALLQQMKDYFETLPPVSTLSMMGKHIPSNDYEKRKEKPNSEPPKNPRSCNFGWLRRNPCLRTILFIILFHIVVLKLYPSILIYTLAFRRIQIQLDMWLLQRCQRLQCQRLTPSQLFGFLAGYVSIYPYAVSKNKVYITT